MHANIIGQRQAIHKRYLILPMTESREPYGQLMDLIDNRITSRLVHPFFYQQCINKKIDNSRIFFY